jgi:hypothetical protein
MSPPNGVLTAQWTAANPYVRSSGTSDVASSRSSEYTPSSISPATSNHLGNRSADPMETTSRVSSGRSQRLSSLDLQSLLQQLQTNQNLYRQIMGNTYSTMFQQDGVKLYFNIEKKKKDLLRKDDKKDEKVSLSACHGRMLTTYETFNLTDFRISQQYEYAMSARFKSPGSDQLVTCKIASSILEPFFGVKPVSISWLQLPCRGLMPYSSSSSMVCLVARAI